VESLPRKRLKALFVKSMYTRSLLLKLKYILILTVFFCSLPYTALANSDLVFPRSVGSLVTQSSCIDLDIEIADTDQHREQGLMFRDTLAPNAGMLLDYQNNQYVTLWMKNTRLPLDMVFIDADGTIRHIHQNAIPYALDYIFSKVKVRYALEVNAGFVDNYALQIGDTFQLKAC